MPTLFWIGERFRPPERIFDRLTGFYDADTHGYGNALRRARRYDEVTTAGTTAALPPDGRLTRYRDGRFQRRSSMPGAIAMEHCRFLTTRPPNDAFNLNIYFDKAIARGRLSGTMLEGHWLTVGTPEAIGEAEETIRPIPDVCVSMSGRHQATHPHRSRTGLSLPGRLAGQRHSATGG